MQIENLRILVIGDIMVDKYLHGSVERISPEAPVPVLSVKREEYRFGGAGNVAANLAALGCNVSLLGLYGKDEMGEQVRLLANKLGIQLPIPGLQNFTTTVKQRALGNGQQLIRLDYEAPNNSSAGILPNMICESLLREVDTVILSDYAKGALNNVEELISYFKNKNIRIVVDPKGHCFNKYQLSSVVTPNFTEFQRIVGQCYSEEEIELRARSLMENLCLDALLLTRSEKGVSLFEKDKPTLHIASSAKKFLMLLELAIH